MTHATVKDERTHIAWPTLVFIAGTSLAAMAWPVYAYFYGVTARQVLLAVVYYFACGMSITVGYHRLIAHRAFKCPVWLEACLLLLGAASWQGSALEWASDHVQHHAYIDTEKDPYNIQRGFWYAHIGWLLRKGGTGESPVPEFIASDRLIQWQHRYYYPIAIAVGFLLPWALTGVGGLLLVGCVRLVLQHHTTWLINSWAHVGSNRPYSPKVSAVDNWFLAFFTFGEGFHNYHHAFPGDYRNGVAKFSFDPSKWTIWTWSKLGMAWDLKRISPQVRWNRKVDTLFSLDATQKRTREMFASMRNAVQARAKKTEARMGALAERLSEVGLPNAEDLAELRARLEQAKQEWNCARDARRLRRAARMQSLIDRLAFYRSLLARLDKASGTYR